MKEVAFKYYGGSEKVVISTNASNGSFEIIPSEKCDWISYSASPTSLTITVTENASYVDRSCRLTLVNSGGTDFINIKQDGYRNMLVDLSLYVVIPYTYYVENNTYDLPIRIYGGSGEYKTDIVISDKIERVFDNSNLYNDYIFHIDKNTNGTFTFAHADKDDYIEYCKRNDIEYNSSNLIKQVVVKNVPKDVLDGYTIFSYYGKEYINALPPLITINSVSPTVISIDNNCFFTKNMEFIENSDFEVKAANGWVKSFYDKEQRKIYLKAINKNVLSDRRCTLTVRNLHNEKQRFTTTILQRASKI